MRDSSENHLTLKSSCNDRRAGGRNWIRRAFKNSGVFSSLWLAALCVAPPALAQVPADSSGPSQPKAKAEPQASNAAQPAVQPQANASSHAEPQMQDQSAPAADSLGEAARKARAHKTQTSGPKVYTEDAVSKLSGHGVSVVGGASAGGGDSSSAGDSSGAAEPYADPGAQPAGASQEQYWRTRARGIRDQMAQLDQQIGGIRDEIAKYGAVQIDPQSGVQAGVIYIKDRNAQIAKIEQQKATLQGQMDALEEEGRKAGADSGWFR
jgi:hypothetical protein